MEKQKNKNKNNFAKNVTYDGLALIPRNMAVLIDAFYYLKLSHHIYKRHNSVTLKLIYTKNNNNNNK